MPSFIMYSLFYIKILFLFYYKINRIQIKFYNITNQYYLKYICFKMKALLKNSIAIIAFFKGTPSGVPLVRLFECCSLLLFISIFYFNNSHDRVIG